MHKLLKILHVVSTVNPAAGGVAESIIRRGVKLVEMGHSVEVVSLDDPTSGYVKDYELKIHALGVGFTAWKYNRNLYLWLKKNNKRFDCVVVEGIWQYHAHATRVALRGGGVPYFVFTHGMLDPWFKKTKPLKHLKKWIFWPWAEYRVIRDAAAVLFTCEEERRLAQESFWLYKANEEIVSFGTALPSTLKQKNDLEFNKKFPQLQGVSFLLFLGRLHPKKGCDILIKAFAQIANKVPYLQLAIAGPGEESYVKYLKDMAEGHGIHHRIHWLGMIQGDIKWSSLRCCEAFILPSHQENFGIAVVEALGSGKPVLISNKVNIYQEIIKGKVGYVEDDDLEGTIKLLEKWISTTAYEKNLISERAVEVFNKNFSLDSMAQSLVNLIGKHIVCGKSD